MPGISGTKWTLCTEKTILQRKTDFADRHVAFQSLGSPRFMRTSYMKAVTLRSSYATVKHLKLLLGSEDVWAMPPEIWIWSISTRAQAAALLVSTQVGLLRVFTHFPKQAFLPTFRSRLTATSHHHLPKCSLDTLFASQFSCSPMYTYLPAVLQIMLLWELAQEEGKMPTTVFKVLTQEMFQLAFQFSFLHQKSIGIIKQFIFSM